MSEPVHESATWDAGDLGCPICSPKIAEAKLAAVAHAAAIARDRLLRA